MNRTLVLPIIDRMTTRKCKMTTNADSAERIRVLVVDDEPLHRDLLSKRLVRHGYDLRTGANGQEAIELANTFAPQVIVMDVKMPIMDGWEAIRELKRDPATRDIPVLALSAFDFSEHRTGALKAGFDYFEPKPVSFDRLLKTIEQALSGVAR